MPPKILPPLPLVANRAALGSAGVPQLGIVAARTAAAFIAITAAWLSGVRGGGANGTEGRPALALGAPSCEGSDPRPTLEAAFAMGTLGGALGSGRVRSSRMSAHGFIPSCCAMKRGRFILCGLTSLARAASTPGHVVEEAGFMISEAHAGGTSAAALRGLLPTSAPTCVGSAGGIGGAGGRVDTEMADPNCVGIVPEPD